MMLDEIGAEYCFSTFIINSYSELPPDEAVFVVVHDMMSDSEMLDVVDLLDRRPNTKVLVDYVAEHGVYFKDRYERIFKNYTHRLVYLTGETQKNIDMVFFYFKAVYRVTKVPMHADQIPFSKFRLLCGNPRHERLAFLYRILETIPSEDLEYSINPSNCSTTSIYASRSLKETFRFNDHEIDNILELGKQVKILDSSVRGVFNEAFNPTLNCDFMLCSETCAIDHIFVTEKTYKLFASGTPFLMFAVDGHLAHLRSLGFHTFGDIINEEYDSISDPRERLEAVVAEANRILTSPNYDDIVRECNKIAAINKRILTSDTQQQKMLSILNNSMRKYNEQ
jgi:hypothetical protein